jgi:hypothetical protein
MPYSRPYWKQLLIAQPKATGNSFTLNLKTAVGTRKNPDKGGFKVNTQPNFLIKPKRKDVIRSYRILSAFSVCY